ncbi:unnamed protein product [Aphis gossypii]|uniref:Uncharacterized protein n=1 Tax=Aphis gossypii TaxID=80765 RepID=A0A9P0JGC7_APHGO|nr:unnamed protein product [Aphis gossypii]
MVDYLNKAMNCVFEMPWSSNEEIRSTTSEYFWLRSAYDLLKTFVYELFLIWAKALMIFVLFGRFLVKMLSLPAKDDHSVLENVIRFLMSAGLIAVIMTVLLIFYGITSVSVKCAIEIMIWMNTLWSSMLLIFGYCRVLFSVVSTVMVVTRSMHVFQVVLKTIRKVFGTSILSWLERPGNRFTTTYIIRCCIFVYGLFWVTDAFFILDLTGFMIMIIGITK